MDFAAQLGMQGLILHFHPHSLVETIKSTIRGVAQPGRVPALGAGCRRFESSRPDHLMFGRPVETPGVFSFMEASLELGTKNGFPMPNCTGNPFDQLLPSIRDSWSSLSKATVNSDLARSSGMGQRSAFHH